MAFAEQGRRASTCRMSIAGRRELMGNFPGMSFAPRFSPDGSRIAMSLSQDGNTDLYEMDVRGRSQRRLTNYAGDRHLAVLFQRRHADRLQLRPRRHRSSSTS